MAKKKKDNFDENEDINSGNSGDINEADDNFGLPEVEYTPVNRDVPSEEEKTTEQENISDPAAEPATEETKSHSATYATAGAAGGGRPSDDDYSYRRYRQNESSNAPKVFVIIAVLLLAAAAIWYFGFYGPQQETKRLEEEQARARQEQLDRDRAAQEERERQEREEAQREADRLAAEEAAASAEPEVGSTETISSRTGRYYVVVASALDGDLAQDYARKLNQEGTNIKILAPSGNNKFHRVAVADFDSWAGAQDQANELKGSYGDEVWVVKF